MKSIIETMDPLEAVRQMLGDQATALDAAYVLRELNERGISIAEASEMDEDDWLALVEHALDAGASEIRDLLRRYDIGIDWSEVEDELSARNLLDAITAWHRATDQAVAGTSETCLAGGQWDLEDAIESAYDPIEEVERQVDWWYRAYRVLDAARREPGQPHLEEACERLSQGDLEGAEALVEVQHA